MKKQFLTILFLLATILVACETTDPTTDGQVTEADFNLLCQQGTPIVDAKAYDPASTSIQHLIAMSDTTIGKKYDDYFMQHLSETPDSWALPRTPDNVYDYSQVPLIACIHQTQAEKLTECPFDDGYTLTIFKATYELTVYAAQTGEKLESSTADLPYSCPSMHMFSEKNEDYYPVIDQTELYQLLAPHVEP